MVDKISKVSNPLTIIAIFAALAEVFGISVLPFLKPEPQGVYIWFSMIFPAILLILFFITLWPKSDSLYAPSDFRDDKAYLDSKRNFMESTNDAEVEEITQQELKSQSNKVEITSPKEKSKSRLLDADFKKKCAEVCLKKARNKFDPSLEFSPKVFSIGQHNFGFQMGAETQNQVILISVLSIVYFREFNVGLIISRASILKAYLELLTKKSVTMLHIYMYDDTIPDDSEKMKNYELAVRRESMDIGSLILKVSELEADFT